MLSIINSGATVGLDAILIQVEVDVAARGLPSLSIVGLADKAVQESKDRVRAALQNSGIIFPAKRITINLAPADVPKIGPAFDVPMALGLLIASGEIQADMTDNICLGELSLDGTLRPVDGVLPIALMAKNLGYHHLFVPAQNAPEAGIVSRLNIYPAGHIKDIIAHITGDAPIPKFRSPPVEQLLTHPQIDIDMSDIRGQEFAKRALEIAAAGGHNVYLKGVPGAGKTMMARAFAGILPKLSVKEALEITKIYSIAGLLSKEQALVTTRPFRSPHHTTSKIGLIGGGTIPKPGEISLAHRGVLFLDEFPEFPRSVIESLRQPLEDGIVHIARASQSNSYPSRFTLIAAANPCPCGHLNSQTRSCTCTTGQIIRYQKKISGPMLDRIDLHITVSAVTVQKLTGDGPKSPTSARIQDQVQAAREVQQHRFKGTSISSNAEMSSRQVNQISLMETGAKDFLTRATAKLGLTARSYFKTIKVARTIADLGSSQTIASRHIAEAIQYRQSLVSEY